MALPLHPAVDVSSPRRPSSLEAIASDFDPGASVPPATCGRAPQATTVFPKRGHSRHHDGRSPPSPSQPRKPTAGRIQHTGTVVSSLDAWISCREAPICPTDMLEIQVAGPLRIELRMVIPLGMPVGVQYVVAIAVAAQR